MIKKADVILALALILVGLAMSWSFSSGQSRGSELVITRAGKIFGTYPLAEDRTIEVKQDRGFIETDLYGQTGAPGIYAIGDIVKGIQLAHVASAQGVTAAEKIAGHATNVDLDIVPSCIYTSPEIASVGITEEDARASGTPVKVGKYITSANGKSLISKEERGFIKIIAHADTDEILGAQMMCARATDMIGEMATAIANKLTPAKLLAGMRAHPTYNEAVGEALEELEGGAIHMAPKKKK